MSPRNQKMNEAMRAESFKNISNAALKVFAELGYHGATLKKISVASGQSYGLVYHYFPSKEKIFLHLVDIAFKNSMSIIDRAMDFPGSAWEKIKKMSDIIVEEIKKGDLSYHFSITQLAMTQVKDLPGITEFITERMGHYTNFEDLVKEAQQDGDVVEGSPNILSGAYLALIQGLTLMMQYDDSVTKELNPEILNNLLRKK